MGAFVARRLGRRRRPQHSADRHAPIVGLRSSAQPTDCGATPAFECAEVIRVSGMRRL